MFIEKLETRTAFDVTADQDPVTRVVTLQGGEGDDFIDVDIEQDDETFMIYLVSEAASFAGEVGGFVIYGAEGNDEIYVNFSADATEQLALWGSSDTRAI